MYGSWRHNRVFFCQRASVCPLTLLATWKIKILKKWKKKTIWCMVPEIWSARGITFCILGQFLPFYPTNNLKYTNFERKKMKKSLEVHHFTLVYHKWQSYDSWAMAPEIRSRADRLIYHCGPFFALLPHGQPRKSKFWKKKKKNTCRYHYFRLAYHKWWSYNVWFLR